MESTEPRMTGMDLEISNPCNERCIHCYRMCRSTKKGFLTAQQAQSVLEQAKALGAERTLITGGESLLNPEWKQIVKAADSLCLRTELFTNGTLMTESDADFIKSVAHLKEVQFSLYALQPEVHDKITGLSGSCKKTLAAIQMLRSRGVPLFVSCLVMQENKAAAADVMRWCDDNEINSCADTFIFGSSDYSGSNLPHRLSPGDHQEFFSVTMQDNARLSYVWGKSKGARDLRTIKFYGEACSSLCVSGDGTIYPMIGWYKPLGNIATDSLEAVFKTHPLLQKLRQISAADIPECASCDCADFCDFCCSPHITATGGALGKTDSEFARSCASGKRLRKNATASSAPTAAKNKVCCVQYNRKNKSYL